MNRPSLSADAPISARDAEQNAVLPTLARLASPVLKRPEQATEFVLEVIEEPARTDLQ